VTPDLRRTAKAVNFGIAYGMGAFGLAENLGIGRKEASEIIDRYFIRFAKVREYMTQIVEQASKTGYVETIFGRRRYIEELFSKNQNVKKFGERAAINAPMQGTASDIVKKAMIVLKGKPKADLLLQVHDELLYESKKDDVEDSSKVIQNEMQSIVKLKVPLKVQVAHGKSWHGAHA
jgi:DNA polymerase-1